MDTRKRRLMAGLTGWFTAGALLAQRAQAAATTQTTPAKPLTFGDGPAHKVVYQLNHAEPEYIEHILNSISAMLSKYVDDVAIAVVAFGPGIHVLATQPTRPVSQVHRTRIQGMAENYGVALIACGNTMKSLNWDETRIIAQARIEDVGVAALMTLQEKGYAYVAW